VNPYENLSLTKKLLNLSIQVLANLITKKNWIELLIKNIYKAFLQLRFLDLAYNTDLSIQSTSLFITRLFLNHFEEFCKHNAFHKDGKVKVYFQKTPKTAEKIVIFSKHRKMSRHHCPCDIFVSKITRNEKTNIITRCNCNDCPSAVQIPKPIQ
jgi:hypothetical protein